LAEFGRDYLGGKSLKTAKRRVKEIPHYVDHGHILIRQSDADAWRDARMQTPASPDLKSMLAEIVARTLQRRFKKGKKE